MTERAMHHFQRVLGARDILPEIAAPVRLARVTHRRP